MEQNIAMRLQGVKKCYRLGQIGGGTLNARLQSGLAKCRGREDPNAKIGSGSEQGPFRALDGIDLTVYRGEALGIIGRNGAGKSTLLKLISRITAPTEGVIDLYGSVSSLLEVGTGFHGEMTGRENVYLNGAILGMSRAEIETKMADIIAFSEVGEFIDTPVKRYSSGMYVKLAFAVAAHLDSEILILDEVLAVGDMAFQKKCLDKMRAAARQQGRTVLYVSHNMHTIRALCDRCIVLERGKILFDGDVDRAIALYMGSGSPQLRRDCAALPREAICRGGVRMQEIEILAEQPVVRDGETLQLGISFTAEQEYPKLLFRMIVFSAGGSPVGMMTSHGFLPAKGGENRVKLRFDVSNLAPGDYTGRLVLYSVNGYGGEHIYDVVDPGIAFRKEWVQAADDTTQVWKSQVWGNVRFPAAEVEADVD